MDGDDCSRWPGVSLCAIFRKRGFDLVEQATLSAHQPLERLLMFFGKQVQLPQQLEEARALAAEALAFHIAGMVADGDAIPQPSTIDQVMEDGDNRDGVAVLIDTPDVRPKAVRINVTFKENVLEQIDLYTGQHRMTRSGFLEEAALEKLAEG